MGVPDSFGNLAGRYPGKGGERVWYCECEGSGKPRCRFIMRNVPHLDSQCNTSRSLRVLSIMPKIPGISVKIQMERFVSVSSDRNIRDHL